jgi:tetratricopeptide (TPR) repeat protein
VTAPRFARIALLALGCAAAAGCAGHQATGLLPAPPMAIRKEIPPAPPKDNAAVAAPAAAAPAPPASDNAAAPRPAPAADNLAAPPPPPDWWNRYTAAIAKTREAIAREKPAEAVAGWQALEDSPYRAEAVFHQGVLRHLSGDIEGAEAIYRRGTDQAPIDEASAANLLGIYLMKGEIAKARELVDRAVPPGAPTGSMVPELVVNAGAVLLESGDAARAASLLDSLASRGRMTPAADWNQAVLAWRKGNAAKARELSAKLPPETAQLWSVTASMAAWDNALANRIAGQYSTAPGGDRRLTPLAVNFDAFRRYRSGKAGDASKLLEDATKSPAGPPELPSNLGLLLIEQGKWKAGRETLEKVTREHPSLPEGWINLGLFREIYAGDAPGAVECYRKYVSLGGYRKDEVSKWIEWLQKPAPPSSP